MSKVITMICHFCGATGGSHEPNCPAWGRGWHVDVLALTEVERLRAEHAALRALALDVAALPPHGMWTADVAPLIERARALLATPPRT